MLAFKMFKTNFIPKTNLTVFEILKLQSSLVCFGRTKYTYIKYIKIVYEEGSARVGNFFKRCPHCVQMFVCKYYRAMKQRVKRVYKSFATFENKTRVVESIRLSDIYINKNPSI